MIGAAFGVGFVLGPALGGLLGNSDPRLPFWVAGGLSLANALYGFLVLPESLPREKRQAFTLRRANPVGALVLLRSHPELFRLATIQFIGYVAHEVFNVWALYAIFRYGWKEGTIGLSLALVGACSIVISAGMVRPIVSRLGERRTLYIGQFFGALGMVLAGLARTSLFFFLSIPVMMLWTISSPAAQGMMTRRVSESEQGELQGAISSLASLAWIIGPGLFTFTFAFFIDQKHGWNIPGRALVSRWIPAFRRDGSGDADPAPAGGIRAGCGGAPGAAGRALSNRKPNSISQLQHEETDFFDSRCDHDFRGNGSHRPSDGAKIYLRHASGNHDGSTRGMSEMRDDAGGGGSGKESLLRQSGYGGRAPNSESFRERGA